MRDNPFIYLLCLILLVYSFVNYMIISYDSSPLLYHSAGYFRDSLTFYRILTTGTLTERAEGLLRFWRGGTWHFPPMTVIFSAPFYFLLGPNQDAAQLSNILFLAVMVFSVYFIGKRLYSATAGFAAACLIVTFPVIIGNSRLYWMYFPMTCWVSLSVCLLLYGDHFKNRLFSVLCGISLGTGFLIRQPFPVFVLGPFLFIGYLSLREGPKAEVIKNILYTVGIALAVSLSWYLPNLGFTRDYLSRAAADSSYGTGLFSFSPERLLFHLRALQNIMLHHFNFYLLLCCAAAFLAFKKRKDEQVLIFWLVFPYIFFALIKTPLLQRYTMPVLPAAALIISVVIGRLHNNHTRRYAYAAVIVIGILQALYMHSSWNPRYQGLSYYLNNLETEGLIKPDRRDWNIEEMAGLLAAGASYRRVKVALLPDIAPLSGGLRYHEVPGNIGLDIVLPTLTPVYDYHDKMELYKEVISRRDFIIQFDYVLLLNGESDTPDFWRTQSDTEEGLFRILSENLQRNIYEFEQAGHVALPYGIGITVYKKRDKRANG